MTGARRPLMLGTTAGDIARAAHLLAQGATVAVPTETVYGLAARADRAEAVASIYRAKGRPGFNPLIVHVSDFAQAARIAHCDERAGRLADRFWPGPLTMVLPLRSDAVLADAVTAQLPTAALRSPAHPVMRTLLNQCAFPLAAPSANRSGGVSPTSAAHVAASLGDRIDAIVDGGPCEEGIESTIVALREDAGWSLLRPGPITAAQIADILQTPPSASGVTGIEAPGQLASHYAPGKPVRLNAKAAQAGEFMIGFGTISGEVNLSPSGDLTEAAARLYGALHLAAQADAPRIAVAAIPDEGMGQAINDRLRRAAA